MLSQYLLLFAIFVDDKNQYYGTNNQKNTAK